MTEPRAWLYEHPEGHLNVSVSRDAHGTWEGWFERPLYGPEAADRIIVLEADVARLREFIANPPKHKFWGAGEPDCPRELKAGNGELHTLRCKVCGLDSPKDDVCRAQMEVDHAE